MDQRRRHQQFQRENSYVSVFKIDRVPILPPLMTAEKREEVLRDKKEAIAVERKLEERRIYQKKCDKVSDKMNEEDTFKFLSDMFRPRSYIPAPIPSLSDRAKLRKQYMEASTSTNSLTSEAFQSTDQYNIQARMVKLSKSETLIYDNKLDSVIMSLDDFNAERYLKENEIIDDIQPKSDIPSICVDPPTPVVSSKPLWDNFNEINPEHDHSLNCPNKPPRRSVTSPSLKPTSNQSSESPLIRSNSFTLDGPSSVLLEHIRSQKIAAERRFSSTVTQHTVESKAKRVKKAEIKKSRTVPKRMEKSNLQSGAIANIKSKRSPYELKLNPKTKLMRKVKGSVVAINKHKQKATKVSQVSDGQALKKTANITDIEDQHRQKFLKLMLAQQCEQQRLQQVFEAQQKKLFDELTAQMTNLRSSETQKLATTSPPSSRQELSAIESPLLSPTELSLSTSPTNSESFLMKSPSTIMTQSLPSSRASSESSNALTSIRCTPRRRLFSRDASPAANGSTTRRNYHEQNIRISAATRINAYVRSFLVRRVLRTAEVQRIVQTIRDTLIFALKLHLDTKREGGECAENIKLKARLLQQLSSASRTLHFVFFQTTVGERMAIIDRDRKRIQNKARLPKKSTRAVT